MARRLRDRLTAAFIASATRARSPKPGWWPDGLGLYLAVAPSGSASWVYRFKINKRPREMGLGSLDDVTLAEARELADAARRKVRSGIDPLEERRTAKLTASLNQAKAMTFQECAEAYVAAHRAGWRNAKHAVQWTATLSAYAYPFFGGLSVQAIDVGLVLKAIEPIWSTKPETASRVRGRVESVLDWAKVRGYRDGENPARWRGHLENLLPKKSKVAPVEHHAALPYSQIGTFVAELRRLENITAPALEFMILTATRTNETRLARWQEINVAERLWTIPAERTKVAKQHRIPLSNRAMAIIERMAEVRQNEFVFPGRGGALAVHGMLALAKKIGGPSMTSHGFRSCFRDWAAERSNFPHEVCEMALGHTVGDAVERAYRRGDMFEKRRQLAEAWSRYCAAPQVKGEIVPIRGAAAKAAE
jgi:integrase